MPRCIQNTTLLLFLLLPFFGLAQLSQPPQQPQDTTAKKKPHKMIGIGLRAGLNFANITHASDLNSSSQTGYHIGLFFSPPGRILASYTELVFSRQGYDAATGENSASTKLDYLYFQQLVAINITKYVQLQLGGYSGYLLNAKKDSSSSQTALDSAGLGSYGSLLSSFNRFDYGVTGGLEIHPIGGLLIGARYNLSFNGLYKQAFTLQPGSASSPTINPKNNVIQLFVGYRF
jgi:Outer membrane protein beta-barrel domain